MGSRGSTWPFLDTPIEYVEKWVAGLKYIRLCKGTHSGHANQGDYYLAKARIRNSADIATILSAFHVASKRLDASGHVKINIVELPGYRESPVSYCPIYIRLSHEHISIKFDCMNGIFATDKDYENAKFIDGFLARCSHLLIDSPIDSEFCICPKYYPQLWPDTMCSLPTSDTHNRYAAT